VDVVTTSQQRANETLILWQSLRGLSPQERLRKLDEYEAILLKIAKEMAS
jgi:hypothetical protein